MQISIYILVGFNITLVAAAIIWGIIKICEKRNTKDDLQSKPLLGHQPNKINSRRPSSSILKTRSSLSTATDSILGSNLQSYELSKNNPESSMDRIIEEPRIAAITKTSKRAHFEDSFLP